MDFSRAFIDKAVSRQKVRQNPIPLIFITWNKANKISMWADAHLDILFALFQVIKIERYEKHQ